MGTPSYALTMEGLHSPKMVMIYRQCDGKWVVLFALHDAPFLLVD